MTDALARFQLDALRIPVGHPPISFEAINKMSIRAVGLAETRGFTVLGRGTSRVAVAVDVGVAKVAHVLHGLVWNLQEAACWLTFPEYHRQRLTPCLALTPELVLIQERVQAIGPALMGERDEDYWEADDQAAEFWAEAIYACRDALGLETDRDDPDKVRPNNFGFTRDGRLVAIDYASDFPPLRAAWAWLLDRLDAGQPLDIEHERERFNPGEAPPLDRLTGREVVERAGLSVAGTDPCPCMCGAAFDNDSPDCSMGDDMAGLLLEVLLGQEFEDAEQVAA